MIPVAKSGEEKARLLELKELEDGINNDTNDNYYPNKSSLILNALIICLEDENKLVKMAALDFMYSHLRLTHEIWN